MERFRLHRVRWAGAVLGGVLSVLATGCHQPDAIDGLFDRGNSRLVLIFVAKDCPISNRYAPVIRRLASEFQAFRFALVYPGPGATDQQVAQHRKEFGLDLDAVRDPTLELVRRTGVRVTPEAAVIVDGELRYRGRIDDRYADFGQQRPEPSEHTLAEAIRAISEGRPVKETYTRAVGCYLPEAK